MKKGVGSGAGSVAISQRYRTTDPRIHTKMSRIPNTVRSVLWRQIKACVDKWSGAFRMADIGSYLAAQDYDIVFLQVS